MEQLSSTVLLGSISVLCLYVFLRWSAQKSRNPLRLPLPPGPKGLPLVGNIRDIPSPDEDESEAYHKLVEQYGTSRFHKNIVNTNLPNRTILGDVMSLVVFGQPIIVLSSAKAANDLFEKRSANYSDRIRLVMINEL